VRRPGGRVHAELRPGSLSGSTRNSVPDGSEDEAMAKYLTLIATAAALLAALPAGAQQPNYPTRPIKIIVSLPPGGGVDTVTRIISDKLQRRLGQTIVIENKGGQSGNIGAEAVFSAEPDGYTLLASAPSPITTNPLLYKSMSFDPAKFTPVAVMTAIPNTLTVRADFPAKTAQEFIAYAKANPGKVSYASQGNGTTSHLTGVMFEQATGTKLLHVPYRGTAPAVNDLMGGHVDALFNEVATSMEMHKAGRARIIAVTTAQRLPELPDIPTMQEAGLAGFVSDTWNAISAPPKTPAPIVAKLNAAINEVLAVPEMQAQLRLLHLQPVGGTPQNMAEFVKSDIKRWGDLIRAANVSIE
jgi:tripartite-type tricarboxylate transporter receptor subunit TctC